MRFDGGATCIFIAGKNCRRCWAREYVVPESAAASAGCDRLCDSIAIGPGNVGQSTEARVQFPFDERTQARCENRCGTFRADGYGDSATVHHRAEGKRGEMRPVRHVDGHVEPARDGRDARVLIIVLGCRDDQGPAMDCGMNLRRIQSIDLAAINERTESLNERRCSNGNAVGAFQQQPHLAQSQMASADVEQTTADIDVKGRDGKPYGFRATGSVVRFPGFLAVYLAGILIGRETQIYKEQATAPGGWKEFKKFRVARKQKENAIVTSFYLEPAEPSPLPSYKPGQYLTVRVPSPDGLTTMRNYSLSDRPGLDHLRISVKRETGPKASTPKGYVSNLLHDKIDVGSTIDIAPPCGEFFLDVNENHDRPLVLLAGGIGITPLYAILRTALSATPERKVVLIYGSLNQDIQTFRDDIAELAAKHKNLAIHFRYSEPKYAAQKRHPASDTGMIDVALVEKLVPEKDADYYFCGPKPFMVNMYHQLLAWGIPASQVHFEFFGPRQELEELAAA